MIVDVIDPIADLAKDEGVMMILMNVSQYVQCKLDYSSM